MKRITRTRQGGYALILMVLALMGIGGVVMTGFTQGAKQEAEHERYLHNQRVLREAKQALLQYAYNYPQLGPGQDDGPGRLPCPDTDNDGFENYEVDCIDHGPDPDVPMVGRLPWKDTRLNFYEAKDASGEVLWYAVSSNFARGLGSHVNSDTNGTIAIEDRSGALLYPATFAADESGVGVAAVIFAPGPPIARDAVLQDRAADANKPQYYLDKFGAAVDNAAFVNADTDDPPDGFVTGPIFNPVDGSLTVNDQMIVITAAEVTAMAEKATLQAYRTAIKDYLVKTGGVYPWLYNYDGIEYDYDPDPDVGESVDVAIEKLSTYFPADASFATEKAAYLGIDTSGGDDGIFGRIPSIFAEYFTEGDSEPIESQLTGNSVTLIDPATQDTYTLTETYCKDGCPQGTGGAKTFNHDPIDDGPILDFDFSQILTGVRFVDIADVVGKDGRLSATLAAQKEITYEVYFWDEDNSPTFIWTPCPAGADQLIDCSRTGSPGVGNYTHTPGVSNGLKARILHMTVTLTFNAGENNFDFDYTNAPAISWTPANSASHATVTGAYTAPSIISFPGVLSATYEYLQHWHHDSSDLVLDENDNTYAKGTVDFTGFTVASLELGIRYYPELPAWAFLNDWHNGIRMAYALEYEPPGIGPCIIDSTCLHLEDSAGTPQDKISVLVIAGQHNWQDLDVNGRLKNDLDTVFDAGNENNNPTFYRHRGNDKVLVIDEL